LLQNATPALPATAYDEAATQHEITSIEASCGTLAHLYMELFAQEGLAQWPVTRLQSLGDAMTRWLVQQGHDDAEAQTGTRRVMQVLLKTLASEHGCWVLKQREQAASEFALASVDGDRTTHHIIDRTFIEDGTRWVIDYKSAALAEVQPETASQLAERYRPQLERYARLFAAEGLPVRKAVLFLSSGQLVELP
jgi:ATP-dependent exoDNAse (exonuclease V) beta subunit